MSGSGIAAGAEWLERIAYAHARDCGSACLGSVGHIDEVARLRGVAAVRNGVCVSLSREVKSGSVTADAADRDFFEIEVRLAQSGRFHIGSDRVQIGAHGLTNTHLDALSHFGVDGTFHANAPCDRTVASDDSILRWARHGLMTRAALFDIPACRDGQWAEIGEPVTGQELETCNGRLSDPLQKGDAVLIYMGRDRYEAAGYEVKAISASPEGRSGVDHTGAAWLADHQVSIVCWDFLDAHGHGAETLGVHQLIWAVGLALVDNCDFTAAAASLRDYGTDEGLLSLAPLTIRSSTGCLVNPLLLH